MTVFAYSGVGGRKVNQDFLAFATMDDIRYLPMIVSFSIFLVQDIYGYVSWKRMKKRQIKGISA